MTTLIIEVPGGQEWRGRRAAEEIYGSGALQWVFNNAGVWVAWLDADVPPIRVYERRVPIGKKQKADRLRAENDRLRNDITLRDGVIRNLEEKRVELNAEIGQRDDQIRALQSKVHLCAGYDIHKRQNKIMRDALVAVTCQVDLQQAAAIANKAMIDCADLGDDFSWYRGQVDETVVGNIVRLKQEKKL